MRLWHSIALISCLQSPAQDVRPIWTQTPPRAEGRIYGVGSAMIASTEAKALEQAVQNARFEVLSVLRQNITGTLTSAETMSIQQQGGQAALGSSQKYSSQTGTTTVQATNLPGLVIEERYVDKKAGNAWALAYLDIHVAETSLKNQLNALQAAYGSLLEDGKPTELRPSITRLQKIKVMLSRATIVEDTANLIAPFGADVAIAPSAHKLCRDMTKEIQATQSDLVMGAKIVGGSLDQEVLAIIRNAAIGQGFVWNQQKAKIFLVVYLNGSKQAWDIQPKAWWQVDARTPDLIGARANIRICIADAAGNEQDSFDLSAKGVAPTEVRAQMALLKDIREQLPPKLNTFLTNLVR